jgi:hypothetical protein
MALVFWNSAILSFDGMLDVIRQILWVGINVHFPTKFLYYPLPISKYDENSKIEIVLDCLDDGGRVHPRAHNICSQICPILTKGDTQRARTSVGCSFFESNTCGRQQKQRFQKTFDDFFFKSNNC